MIPNGVMWPDIWNPKLYGKIRKKYPLMRPKKRRENIGGPHQRYERKFDTL
jgi:hypothetical protein